jgi:hypothetical protein
VSRGVNRARVTVTPRRLWSLRASLAAARWLLYTVALVGIVATARDAIAPPRPSVVTTVAAPGGSDAGAEWFALSFARAYLAWAPNPSTHEGGLSPFLGGGDSPDAGVTPAIDSSEQVTWAAIAAERQGPAGEHDYTVAAGTAAGTVVYLAVAVRPGGGGSETLARYPALVGAPAPVPAGELDGSGMATVSNDSVVAVLDRALRNYVDASTENLDADLALGARVAAVAPGLVLRGVLRLAVEPSGAVLATVLAADARGDLFTLAYELTLGDFAGRWEITRIQS